MVRSTSSRPAADSKISLIRMIFAKPFPFLTYMYLYRHVSFWMHDKPHYVIRRDLEKSAAWKMGFMLSAAPWIHFISEIVPGGKVLIWLDSKSPRSLLGVSGGTGKTQLNFTPLIDLGLKDVTSLCQMESALDGKRSMSWQWSWTMRIDRQYVLCSVYDFLLILSIHEARCSRW